MKILYLVRGLPGAGKSTLARKISPLVFEADDYFIEHGVYLFNPERLSNAHNSCLARTKEALESGAEIVAVANTFSRQWELTPYYNLISPHMDCSVVEITVQVPSLSDEELAARCIHKVPVETIKKMRERWEP